MMWVAAKVIGGQSESRPGQGREAESSESRMDNASACTAVAGHASARSSRRHADSRVLVQGSSLWQGGGRCGHSLGGSSLRVFQLEVVVALPAAGAT